MMQPRTGVVTSSKVDLTLVLLPEITWLKVCCMLAVSGVPTEVAAGVLALPWARRVPPAQ